MTKAERAVVNAAKAWHRADGRQEQVAEKWSASGWRDNDAFRALKAADKATHDARLRLLTACERLAKEGE